MILQICGARFMSGTDFKTGTSSWWSRPGGERSSSQATHCNHPELSAHPFPRQTASEREKRETCFCIMETGPRSRVRFPPLPESMYATTGVSASSGTAFHPKKRLLAQNPSLGPLGHTFCRHAPCDWVADGLISLPRTKKCR